MRCLKCGEHNNSYNPNWYCNPCMGLTTITYGQPNQPEDEFDEEDETEVQVDEDFYKRLNGGFKKGDIVRSHLYGCDYKVIRNCECPIPTCNKLAVQGIASGRVTVLEANKLAVITPKKYNLAKQKMGRAPTKPGGWKEGRKYVSQEPTRSAGSEEPPKSTKVCDCGAEKAQTTHATWCTAYEAERPKEKTPWKFQGGCL